MEQLLAHLVGDFILQNHWMANRKTQVTWIAVFHAVTYGLPFLFLTRHWQPLALIVVSHFIIDRWRLARVVTDVWGTGKPGVVMPFLAHVVYVIWPGTEERRRAAEGVLKPPDESPAWLTVWLLFIVDNIIHLAINHVALKWLPV